MQAASTGMRCCFRLEAAGGRRAWPLLLLPQRGSLLTFVSAEA
jgi:hypothetical protein